MTYILAHKFGDSCYFVQVLKNKWNEIYDPEFATTFASKESALNWSKENTTMGEYAVVLNRDRQLTKFKRWAASGMIRRKFDVVNKKISRPYNGETPLEILNWYVSYKQDADNVRYEDYETWPDLYTVYKHIWGIQTYDEKDYSKTYISFSMCVKKKSTFEKFISELRLILPFITYIEDGYKYIDIFDHYLSEHGNSATFYYKSDDDCKLEVRYGDEIAGDLKTIYKYWKKERYYN